MSVERRSVTEVRSSLSETRARLCRDMEELDVRLHSDLSPKQILSRHPTFFTIAGAAIGLMLIVKPKLLKRSLATMAQLSAPLLVKALLKKT